MPSPEISVVGGGAAGFFAAITAAEANPAAKVTLFEATAHLLAKVRISGGGRCNVTHACPEPRELVKFYPRGAKELRSAFHRFGPRDTIAWYAARGVTVKTEPDGRMFPDTDDSGTIVDCLRGAADKAGVVVRERCGVKSVERREPGFALNLGDGSAVTADRLIIATGGGRASTGFNMARFLGHTIEPLVPSLFTLHIDDARIRDLAGVSVPQATASLPDAKIKTTGPALITHWGLSGPAILKLSAWAARALHDVDYRATLRFNWIDPHHAESAFAALNAHRQSFPKRKLSSGNPFGLPGRLWDRLVVAAGLTTDTLWTGSANPKLRALAQELTAGEYLVTGKSMNKEEFVTCGGVTRSEVDFRTMESRQCPGLYFAGEVLDVDGVTGGFNFQAAWTTGFLAGSAAAAVAE